MGASFFLGIGFTGLTIDEAFSIEWLLLTLFLLSSRVVFIPGGSGAARFLGLGTGADIFKVEFFPCTLLWFPIELLEQFDRTVWFNR